MESAKVDKLSETEGSNSSLLEKLNELIEAFNEHRHVCPLEQYYSSLPEREVE